MWSGHDPIENRKSTELYSVAKLGGLARERDIGEYKKREEHR